VLERAVDGHGLPHARRLADHEAELELDVEPPRGAEVAGPALTVRAADVRPADDNGSGAAVVADRQVPPVRRQRLLVRPEHPPHVRRVLE
jgi:hypothetical protein